MADATLDVVERVLDEVDKSRDVDWTILGERLRSAILDSGEHIDAGFTEAQKAAIVAVCRETYYATSVVARAYAFKAAKQGGQGVLSVPHALDVLPQRSLAPLPDA